MTTTFHNLASFLQKSCYCLALTLLLGLPACKKNAGAPLPIPIDSLGAGWTKRTLTVGSLSDVFFVDNQVGFAVGIKVYKSTDGGNTWQNLVNQSGYNLFATTAGRLFIVGDDARLDMYTAANTQLVSCFPASAPANFTDVFFSDVNTGYFVKNNFLYKTTDAGGTWNPVNPPIVFGEGPVSMFFVNNTTGWIIAGNKIYKTNGNSIAAPVIFNSTTSLHSIHALSSLLLYVAAGYGSVYKSVDGGLSFISMARLPQFGPWVDIAFVDDLTGYVSVASQIFKTIDGALTWTQVVRLETTLNIEIHFTDANHGWACTTDGTILIFKQ